MITAAQNLADRPPMAFAPFKGLISDLIATAEAYQRGLDAERARKEAISNNMRKAAQGQMIARGNYVSKDTMLAWLKDHPGLARFEIAEATGGTRTRVGTLLAEMLEEGKVIRGGSRRLPTWSAR